MGLSEQTVIGLVIIAVAIINSGEPWAIKLAEILGTAIAMLLVRGFGQAIVQRLPNVVRRISKRAWQVVTHPLVSMVILLGLLGVAYVTLDRAWLIAVGGAMLVLVPLRLGWQGLLRSPPRSGSRTDLLASLEVLEGDARAGLDSPGVVELPYQGTRRNTFVLVRGPALRDVRVEFDAILKPNALLNVVLRYNTEARSGYMLRIDSRENSFNAILIMTGGDWGPELHLSQFRTPADTWVHVIASAQGLYLHLDRGNEVVSTADDGTFNQGRVGFFSEVADAAIRGVVVTGG